MSWYIGTREEVEGYNAKVNEAKAYKGSITSNWAIIAHSTEPDEESRLTLVEELNEDWNSEVL